MSHFEDDDPPIKTHPASKEYRENWDRIFGAEEKPAPTENAEAVRKYLADGGEPSPIGWYGVVTLDALEPAFVTEARAAEKPWERREQARGEECVSCGAPGTMSCDDAIHATTGAPTRPEDKATCGHCGRPLDEYGICPDL